MKYLIVIILFFNNACSYSQIIRTKLIQADTVIIVSHKITQGVKLVDDSTGKNIPLPKLLIKGKRNKSIIVEQKIITGKDLDTLMQILARPFADKFISIGKCFMPHHSIFIIKNGKTSFIELCFGCHRFETSKDLNSIEAFDEKKWDDLEKYFIKQGFKYELEQVAQ